MSDQPGTWPEGAAPSVAQLEAMFALEAPADAAREPAPLGGLPVAAHAPGWQWPAGRPEYPGLDAWEHARRLLRRAVNADRPAEELLRRLARARAYDIERLPEPAGPPSGAGGWCAIYEHAFLLDDDSELCLYELEHDLTADCQLVCEVYADEPSAVRAARGRARARRRGVGEP